MRVFLSYHETEEGECRASALRKELAVLGVDATMARHSIRPGADWAQTIRTHLEASSALLCVASQGYTASPWCQQEIGWAIGRNLPVLWVRYEAGEHSVAFLAAQQDLIPLDVSNSAHIAENVGSWLASAEETREEMKAALLAAFADSQSFRQTRCIANVIGTLGSLTKDEWRQIDAAAEENPQVAYANHFNRFTTSIPITKWLRKVLNEGV